jgi:chaperone modulatory protein CbpM
MTGKQTSSNMPLVLDDDYHVTLGDLCRICGITAEQVLALVDEGVIEPAGQQPGHWRFHAVSIRRVRCVYRLNRDLGINLAGAALAVELLEEIEHLRARLQLLERMER